MITLRLEEALADNNGHSGEVLACAFASDNARLITTGWDGTLRCWDASSGTCLDSLQLSEKPITACAVSPDNDFWLVGTMEGMLGRWDVVTREQHSMHLAHTRPISSLTYSPDGSQFASVSWDRTLAIWNVEEYCDGRTVGHHSDIAAGCRFTPDGQHLVSWAYDGSVIVWNLETRKQSMQLDGHNDRITAGDVAPDGKWLLTGSRNGELKLWELESGSEVNSIPLTTEVRACHFLRDAESAVVADAGGRLTLHQIPTLQMLGELQIQAAIEASALAPSGAQLAFGDSQGRVHFVALDGFDGSPLAVTALEAQRESANMLQRLMGKKNTVAVLQCVCPACRAEIQISPDERKKTASCPQCQRAIRVCAVAKTENPVLIDG